MKYLVFITLTIYVCSCNTSHNESKERTINSDSLILVYANRYLEAIRTQSVQGVEELLHPIIGEYLIKEFPEEWNNSAIPIISKQMLDAITESEKKLNIKMKFRIGDITNKVTYKDNLIYSVETFIEYKKDGKLLSFPDEILGISNDRGRSWKFLSKNPENFKDVLKIRFPSYVVEKVK